MLAIALAGTDDPQPNKPQPPSPPFTIEIRINGLKAQEPACQTVAAATTATPPTPAKPADPSPGCSKAGILSCTPPMPWPKITRPRKMSDPEAQETWPMTLEQAIRIALDNSEIVRVIAFGAQGIPIGGFVPTPSNTGVGVQFASALASGTLGRAEGITLPGQTAGPPVVPKANSAPIVIARLNADSAIWRFKADVMAQVRSVEQQYWNLAQAHVQLWSAEQAVREILRGVTRNEALIVFPAIVRWIWRLYRALPAVIYWVSIQRMRVFRKLRNAT